MPAIKTGGLAADEQLVKVSAMEEWAQLAFEGYKCALLVHSCHNQGLSGRLRTWDLMPWPARYAKAR